MKNADDTSNPWVALNNLRAFAAAEGIGLDELLTDEECEEYAAVIQAAGTEEPTEAESLWWLGMTDRLRARLLTLLSVKDGLEGA